MNKAEYLKGLKAAEIVETEVARDEPAKAAPDKPAVEKPAVEKPAAEKPPAEKPAPAAPAPAATPAATPAELFPGFATMPKEIQESIAAKFALAEQAKAREEEANRLKRDFQLSQQRLTPMQQQLSEIQRRNAELAKKLEAAEAQRRVSPDVKAKIKDMRENFPDDADILEAALNHSEEAESKVSAMETRFAQLEKRLHIQTQLAELAAAHPDWQKKRVGVLEDGSFVRTVDTPEAEELEVWSNSLDDFDKDIIRKCILSENARDNIYVLNRFEQDREVARVLASKNGSGVPSAEGDPAAPPAAVKLPTPEPDPDPQSRITAPARTPAGQPVSEKKRQFLEAAAFLKKQKALHA